MGVLRAQAEDANPRIKDKIKEKRHRRIKSTSWAVPFVLEF
jgi:hypothetical protein